MFQFNSLNFKETTKFGHTDQFSVFLPGNNKFDFPVIVYDSSNEIKVTGENLSAAQSHHQGQFGNLFNEEGDNFPFISHDN